MQPFIAIAKCLQAGEWGHRVRICTHPVFKGFVEENGIEFFSIGGDPATLMAYMVKNPGLMPGMESLKAGDVGKRRADIAEILEGCVSLFPPSFFSCSLSCRIHCVLDVDLDFSWDWDAGTDVI